MKLYAISGLGADKRVFDYLKLKADLITLDWIIPTKDERIEDYAMRLAQAINKEERFGIIGVSFGGLVAVEISKKLNPAITILISSAETQNELPILYRVIGKTSLVKIFPERFFKPPVKVAYYLFGAVNKKLLNDIIVDTDTRFAKWAINQLLKWKNVERLKNSLKISGTEDKLIPPAKDDKTKLVKGGHHFMIVDRAEEISEIINEQLKQEFSRVII